MAHLKDRGIASAIYYPVPLHLQECFAHLGHGRGDFPVAERTADRILSLPVHPMLGDEDIQWVADAIAQTVGSAVRTTPDG